VNHFAPPPVRFEPKQVQSKLFPTEKLKRLKYEKVRREIAPDPFRLPVASDVVFDVECFRNYFLVGFKHLSSGMYFFAHMKRGEAFPVELVRRAMFWFRVIGFNSANYDLIMVEAALRGMNTDELKALSDEIILDGKRPFMPNVPYNHIDLIDVAPLEGSLKLYAGRLHAKRLQELPIDVHAELSEEDIDNVIEYNFNDLDLTELLFDAPKFGLRPHVDLRERLGKEINEDIRSHSDAQVAEAFINARLKEITGRYPKTPTFPEDYKFHYKAPSCVQYQNPQLRDILALIEQTPFELDAAGRPAMPRELANLKIRIGGSVYKLGLGGLHSSEKNTAFRDDEDHYLIDRDVASFYPWLIIRNEWYPEHLGPQFLNVYRDELVLRRLALKKAKDPLEAGLKIAINGTFGKLGSPYSTIYSPNLLLQVTISGQLYLLMLIDMIEQAGISVMSGNTDGVVIRCPKHRYAELEAIIKEWEARTQLETEETRYKALYCRDVNNYIALKYKSVKGEDGREVWTDEVEGAKVKGYFSEKGSAQNSPLSKNPETLICSEALQAFLWKGTAIADTIRHCTDVRKFVALKNVKGGGHKDGFYLGKVVRWYYGIGQRGTINYVNNGNTVGTTEAATPLMELDEIPHDLDYEFYIRRAEALLHKIGFHSNATRQTTLF
jgi:hypothetical protein